MAEASADAGHVSLDWKDVPRWADVLARAGSEDSATALCNTGTTPDSGSCRYAAWRASLPALRDLPALERINAVQTAINRLPYVSDLQNWSMADRWATPAEMFARGGDCEDYALTKYFALRELGFPEAAMKLAIVWDNQDSEQHAVLLVHSEGALWMLDNKFAAPMPAADFAGRYRVIYALNSEGASFSPAALGAQSARGPRLAAGGRMLVFRTRPVRRASDAPPVQFAAVLPKPKVAPVETKPVALASLTPAPALMPLPAWLRRDTLPERFRAMRFSFAAPAPMPIQTASASAPHSATQAYAMLKEKMVEPRGS